MSYRPTGFTDSINAAEHGVTQTATYVPFSIYSFPVGTPILTITTPGTPSGILTAANIGEAILVYEAGTNGADLWSTITAFTPSASVANITNVAFLTGQQIQVTFGSAPGWPLGVFAALAFSPAVAATFNGTFDLVSTAGGGTILTFDASGINGNANVIKPTFTVTAVDNAGNYTGTFTNGASNAYAGSTFTVSGFANLNNNGTFTCTASSATTLTLTATTTTETITGGKAILKTYPNTAATGTATFAEYSTLANNAAFNVTNFSTGGQLTSSFVHGSNANLGGHPSFADCVPALINAINAADAAKTSVFIPAGFYVYGGSGTSVMLGGNAAPLGALSGFHGAGRNSTIFQTNNPASIAAFVPQSSVISNIAETAGSIVTLTVAAPTNHWLSTMYVSLAGLTTGTWLNGHTVTLLPGTTDTSLVFADPTSHGTQASHAETGTASAVGMPSGFIQTVGFGSVANWSDFGIIGNSPTQSACTLAAVTHINIASNVLTVTAANGFTPGQNIGFGYLTNAIFLSPAGESSQSTVVVTVLTASPTQFTANFTHANYDANEYGICGVAGPLGGPFSNFVYGTGPGLAYGYFWQELGISSFVSSIHDVQLYSTSFPYGLHVQSNGDYIARIFSSTAPSYYEVDEPVSVVENNYETGIIASGTYPGVLTYLHQHGSSLRACLAGEGLFSPAGGPAGIVADSSLVEGCVAYSGAMVASNCNLISCVAEDIQGNVGFQIHGGVTRESNIVNFAGNPPPIGISASEGQLPWQAQINYYPGQYIIDPNGNKQVVTAPALWLVGTSYSIGQTVSYPGLYSYYYTSLTNSNVGNDPTTDNTHWTLAGYPFPGFVTGISGISGASAPTWNVTVGGTTSDNNQAPAWSSGTTYTAGQIATRSGVQYYALNYYVSGVLQTNLNHDPTAAGTVGTYWAVYPTAFLTWTNQGALGVLLAKGTTLENCSVFTQTVPLFNAGVNTVVRNLDQTFSSPQYPIALTGQTGTISGNLYLPPSAGKHSYTVNYYVTCTTAGTGGTLTPSITWTDENAVPQTFTGAALSLTVQGSVSGSIFIVATSASNVSATFTVAGATGGPIYSATATAEQA